VLVVKAHQVNIIIDMNSVKKIYLVPEDLWIGIILGCLVPLVKSWEGTAQEEVLCLPKEFGFYYYGKNWQYRSFLSID
jgi:hypothetical protein